MPDPYLPDRRDFDPNDPNPCQGCSNCCEYISLELDRPKSLKDFDQIIWYLIHKDVWVYIDEDKDWYVQFNTVCEKLDQDSRRCNYYVNRPYICREYEPESCLRHGEIDHDEIMMHNEIDLFKYLVKYRPKTFEKLREKNDIPFTVKEIKAKGGL